MVSVAMYSLDEFIHAIRCQAHAVLLKNDYPRSNDNMKDVNQGGYSNSNHIDIADISNSFHLIRRLIYLQLFRCKCSVPRLA